jgi:norsolorinic acid ketoreductase
MTSNITYLVTGGNRGIGKGFVSTLLQRPSSTVIVAVRDPSATSSKALNDLPKSSETKLILVKLDSSVETDAAEAISQLKSLHDITALDVVIANAGIAADGSTVRDISIANTKKHFAVNVLGPLTLFQATADLLKASKSGNPKFVAVSTVIGSIGFMDNLTSFPNTQSPYGGSKAALNWFVRRLHFEEPWLSSWVFHPGLVETDMANEAINGSGITLEQLGAISVDTSVKGMIETIDKATRDISGTFKNYDGSALPW